jgi:hypothetical protein
MLRIRRLLRPAPPLRLPVRLAVLTAVALGPTVPYLLTCGPIDRPPGPLLTPTPACEAR